MNPFDHSGNELVATFSVVGVGTNFDVTFESGNGLGRNSDYADGVDVVLERLSDLGATLTRARITSGPVMKLVAEKGFDPSFEPQEFVFPLRLRRKDTVDLRQALCSAGSRIGSQSSTGHNTTRRMTLTIALPSPPVDAPELERALAGRTMLQPLTMMSKLSDIDAALEEWLKVLNRGSRPARGGRVWMSEEMVMLKASPSNKRVGAFDVQLGVRSSGKPWSVEINAPGAAADPNGLVSVAINEQGHRFLLRQGRLRPNPDSDGEVEGARFRTLSGLEPVTVTGVVSRVPRDWYVVADIDSSDEEIRRQTGDFVHACARARLGSKGIVLPLAAPPTFASDEKGGVFLKKATDATREKEILRLQGEVWLALRRMVELSGRQLLKLRHDAGYEVDGIILTEPSNILIEIKTCASAKHVYEGVGQLILYSRMLGLADHRRILLLPAKPSTTLVAAVEAEGIVIATYDIAVKGTSVQIGFSDAFLSICSG